MFVHPYVAALLAAAKRDDYLGEARRAALARDVGLREAAPAPAARNAERGS